MPGKIFVNYRRDDERAMAARIRDRLAQTFGNGNVFMDVDHLMAGQRFDRELEKALAQTDIFLAVIGSRWMGLLAERHASGERDYVREEISGALKRGVVVIPVLIDGTPLPRADGLAEDLRELVLHQKHVVTHEQFGRDVAGLVKAIRFARGPFRAKALVAVALAALMLGGGLVAHQMGVLTSGVSSLQVDAKQVDQSKPDTEKIVQETTENEARQRMAANSVSKEEQSELRKRVAALTRTTRPPRPLTTAEESSFEPQETFKECEDCPSMVIVPAGEFMMGSPDSEEGRGRNEGPQQKVTIAKPFAVGKFEITFAEWDACVAASGCTQRPDDTGWGRGRRPLINVAWNDAKEYATWLSRKTGKSYRLPTEAEWEYSARAGTTTPFATGATISTDQANYDGNVIYGNGRQGVHRRKTVDVGSFLANAFGLHDMHGNVWEWVADCHKERRAAAPERDTRPMHVVPVADRPTGLRIAPPEACAARVVRGGSWSDGPALLRSAARFGLGPDSRLPNSGFRVARSLSQ